MGESLAESQGDAKWAGECERGVEAERSGFAQLEVIEDLIPIFKHLLSVYREDDIRLVLTQWTQAAAAAD